MNCGFLVRCRQGRAEFLTPDNAGLAKTNGPLVTVAHDDTARQSAAIVGRLHYRRELVVAGTEVPTSVMNDAQLALAVYQRSGVSGLEKLEGEFSLVIWDARNCRLLAMRDPLGAWPLFWTSRGSHVFIGTNLRQLTDATGRSQIDLDFLADFFTRPFIPAEVPTERTARAGIQRILPGTWVEVRCDGQSQSHRYWDWASCDETVAETSLPAVGERFQELLRAAVHERLGQRRVAAHLSGGMDSSTIAILAHQELSTVSSCDPLVTLSLTHAAAELKREREYINLVLQNTTPVEPVLIDAERASGFDWFSEQGVPQHDEPYTGLWDVATHRLMIEAAAQQSVGTILTGVGADEILTYRPLHIADALRQGKCLFAVREAAVWARAQGQGILSVFGSCGVRPLLAGRGRAVARIAPRRSPSGSRFAPAPWLSPDFVRQYHLEERSHDFARQLYAAPAERSETLNRVSMTAGDWARWHLLADRGIEISHPFEDPRVMRYALAVPRHLRATPGEPKPVLQMATKGLLPEAIRTRREKTGFDGPHARGLAKHLPQLEELVGSKRIRELGIIDVEQLRSPMQRVALGLGSEHNERLDKTLATIAWFEQV